LERKQQQLARSATPEKSSHRLILEIRDSKSVLICQHCEKPILEIENGEINIGSKHGSSKHKNILTIEYLKLLVFEMQRQKGV
jgi:hypothetical protein